MHETSSRAQVNESSPPRRLILAVACIVSLGLLASAFYTYFTLSRLCVQYLSNRGHEIVMAIDSQARGPQRRNNPAFWQPLLETSYENYSKSVAFIALVDENGKVLAGKGDASLGPLGSAIETGRDIYQFEEVLLSPRHPRHDANAAAAGWRIRIGLYSSDTDFIRRSALFQLAASGLAVVLMLSLSVFLMRMIHKFLELKAREGAEAQLKSLGIMAASLAHEIRNPLGAMKGLTQLAQEELAADAAAQARLSTVVSEAERLERLVTDLLDFARPKEPQISEFDLMDLLADVRSMLAAKLEASRLRLEMTGDSGRVNIRSDPGGLRQVLLNVILNAIDASPEGAEIAVGVVRDARAGMVDIQIDDAGPGLGERDAGELYQPFVTTKARGTGLGLAVSRQIIERLGGSLHLSDNPSGGGRCRIRVPLH